VRTQKKEKRKKERMITKSLLFLNELEGLFPLARDPCKQYDYIARQYDHDAKKAIETLEHIYTVRHRYPELERRCFLDLATLELFIRLAQEAVNNPTMMKRLLTKKYSYSQLFNFNSL
jgi:hypothetical protein